MKEGIDATRIERRESEYNAILGMLLLKSDLPQLEQMTRLPDALERLGLSIPADALRFALGHKVDFPPEVFGVDNDQEAARRFFGQMRQQPAYRELPELPALYADPTVSLTSTLLGCRITIESDNVSPCVELTESVLAALESLGATGLADGIFGREPSFTATVRLNNSTSEPFAFAMQERAGRHHVEIRCSAFDPHSLPLEDQRKIKDGLLELLASVIARLFFVADTEVIFTKLFRDDRALDRSLHFTSTIVTLGNVLGHSPKNTLSAWCDPSAQEYLLLRSARWDADERAAGAAGGVLLGSAHDVHDKAKPIDRPLQFHRAKHTDIETMSLIREPLWERAEWKATLFLSSLENDSEPPALGPAFKVAAPAGEIFAQWRKELGPEDTKEAIRVVIIRGFSKAKPFSYRVLIGSNAARKAPEHGRKVRIVLSKVNTMDPTSNANLERFLGSYRRAGAYFLIHGIFGNNPADFEPVRENSILKKELIVKHAWEIGKDDPDGAGLCENDDPIIAPDQKQAPVLELLVWRRQRVAEMNSTRSVVKESSARASHDLSPKERAERRKANRKREKRAAKKKRNN